MFADNRGEAEREWFEVKKRLYAAAGIIQAWRLSLIVTAECGEHNRFVNSHEKIDVF